MSVWNVYQCTMSSLAHYIEKSSSEIMKNCAKMDTGRRFSIKKRAAKYIASENVSYPPDFHEKSVLTQARIIAKSMKTVFGKKRLEDFLSKSQHGVFFRQIQSIDGINCKKFLGWLNKCYLSPNDEGYLCAAQELALFTKYHEKNILRNSMDDRCRVCRVGQETITHLLSGCDNLARKEYIERHDNVGRYVHMKVCNYYSISTPSNWYLHKPKDVIICKMVEIVWNQVILTDRPCGANKPDILIKDRRYN